MASTSLEAACARDPRLGWRSPSAKNASEVRHAVVPACKSRSGGAETEEYANAVAPAFVASFASVSALTCSMARRSAATVTAGGAYVSTVTNTRGGGEVAFAFDEPAAASAMRLAASSNADAKHDAVGAANARSDAACATIHAADADAPSVSADAVDTWHPPGGPVKSVTGTGVSRRGVSRRVSGRVSGSVVGASFPLEYRRVVSNPEAAFAASATRASGACVGNVLCGVSPATAAAMFPACRWRASARPTAHLCASVARAYAGSAAATRNVAADDSDSATVSSFAFAAAARHLGTISRRNLRRAATGTADREKHHAVDVGSSTLASNFVPGAFFAIRKTTSASAASAAPRAAGSSSGSRIPSWTSTATTFTPTTNASGGADAETNATPFSKAYHAPASAPSPASTSSSAVGSSVSRKRSTPSIRGARSRGPNANAGSNA